MLCFCIESICRAFILSLSFCDRLFWVIGDIVSKIQYRLKMNILLLISIRDFALTRDQKVISANISLTTEICNLKGQLKDLSTQLAHAKKTIICREVLIHQLRLEIYEPAFDSPEISCSKELSFQTKHAITGPTSCLRLYDSSHDKKTKV